MSKFIFVFLFVAVAVSGIAMIETLSLEELVASSDLVLVGRVVACKDFEVTVDEEGTELTGLLMSSFYHIKTRSYKLLNKLIRVKSYLRFMALHFLD